MPRPSAPTRWLRSAISCSKRTVGRPRAESDRSRTRRFCLQALKMLGKMVVCIYFSNIYMAFSKSLLYQSLNSFPLLVRHFSELMWLLLTGRSLRVVDEVPHNRHLL